MSIHPGRPIAVCPAEVPNEAPPQILYWPAVAIAAVSAVILVGGCLVAAWIFARPGAERKGVGATPAAQSVQFPASIEPSRKPPARGGEPVGSKTARNAWPRPAQLPLLAFDGLPGESVGRRRGRAPHAAALTDPELASIPDAVQAEQPTGGYGTQIEFLDNPADAARRALKEHKLLFTLHVSGNFEDAKFT